MGDIVDIRFLAPRPPLGPVFNIVQMESDTQDVLILGTGITADSPWTTLIDDGMVTKIRDGANDLFSLSDLAPSQDWRDRNSVDERIHLGGGAEFEFVTVTVDMAGTDGHDSILAGANVELLHVRLDNTFDIIDDFIIGSDNASGDCQGLCMVV
jgi:hypothetical protein